MLHPLFERALRISAPVQQDELLAIESDVPNSQPHGEKARRERNCLPKLKMMVLKDGD
jgi:hypothetical protein